MPTPVDYVKNGPATAPSLDQILARVDTSHHWICRPGQAPEHVDLALPAELHGKPYARGACPIRRGESTTRLALLDLDSHKGETPWATMAETAARVTAELERRGLKPTPVRSSGGNGVHLYVLWRGPQDAYSVRETLRESLAACGLRNGTGGVAAGEVEIFPKQNSVRADGAGSMFVLPFANKSVPLEPLADYAPCESVTWRASNDVPKRERPAREAPSTPFGGAAYEQLRRELFAQNPDAGYEEWNRACAVAHHKSGGEPWGLDLVEEWCLSAKGLHGIATREQLETKWASYGRHENPATEFPRAERAASPEEFDVVAPTRLADANVTHDRDSTAEVTQNRFTPVPWPTFSAGRPLEWRVKDLIPQAELVVIYGESGSGKTFVTLDIVASIARGIPWREKRVKRGRVVVVCAEGQAGFRKRLTAYAQQHNVASFDEMPIGVIADAPNLLEGEQALELARAIVASGGADVIVVDTLSATTPGGNENSGEDVGKVIAHCKGLHRATGAVVILVHHSGKDSTKGARGWSGLRAAADAELEVTCVADARLLSVTKLKDGDDGQEFGFKLAPIMVGVDDDGQPVTSCVAQAAEAPAGEAGKKRKLGDVEKIVLEVVRDLQPVAGTGGAPVRSVFEEAAKHVSQDPGKKDQRSTRVRRALDSLVRDGLLVLEGEEYRVC